MRSEKLRVRIARKGELVDREDIGTGGAEQQTMEEGRAWYVWMMQLSF